MKVSIIYHSETGNTKAVAELIAKGAQKIEGVDCKCMSIFDVDVEFANASSAVVIGCPIYAGGMSYQIKQWLDVDRKVNLAGKLGAVFATENYLGGGADAALLTLAGALLVRGMMVYSAGASCGHPYTHFGAVCIKSGSEQEQERATVFGERIARKSQELFGSN